MRPEDITGLILAGGRGSRMGGVDKGLQPLRGQPLVRHTLERLRAQVGPVMINANRNLEAYAALGVAVLSDETDDFPGPLAGMLSGLESCSTPWLVTVPCDTPGFPRDLVARLADAARREGADIAMAAGRESGDPMAPCRTQPVFCLLRSSLATSLRDYLAQGQRKIDRWTALHRCVVVPFDAPGDDATAFVNANTLQELQALESGARP